MFFTEWTLTGRTRYRRGLFGRLVLQCEEKGAADYGWKYRWRDARVQDATLVIRRPEHKDL